MTIKLKQIGTTLTSRPAGKEALSALSSVFKNIPKNELIIIDFEGVNTFSPSWGDEFLTPLLKERGKNLRLININNPSVKATLEILEETNGMKFITG